MLTTIRTTMLDNTRGARPVVAAGVVDPPHSFLGNWVGRVGSHMELVRENGEVYLPLPLRRVTPLPPT